MSDEEKVVSLDARDVPERRPERKGDRGLKMVEIGLTGQGGESSEKAPCPCFDSIGVTQC